MFIAAGLRALLPSVFFRKKPARKYQIYRLRLFAATFAGAIASASFLLFYYLTLGTLPIAFDSWTSPHTTFPISAWAYRFDLSQMIGSLIDPPWPSPITWWLGIAILFGCLCGAGVTYAWLLSWSLSSSSLAKGTSYGLSLFIVTGFGVWIAGGLQPAIMRSALPDVGFFFLGWSGLATLQVLVAFLLYGGVLAGVYGRWTR